jgi:hypothetical protein
MRYLPAALLAAALAAPATPLPAQDAGLTLAEVERQYRRMSVVHIRKCDYDGNGIFTRTEMLCVQNVYRVFYLDND